MSGIPDRVKAIIREVATECGVPVEAILSDRQTWIVAGARWTAMRRVRSMTMLNGEPPSYTQIGRWFGRDHSTVINACGGAKPRTGNPRYRDPSPRPREFGA